MGARLSPLGVPWRSPLGARTAIPSGFVPGARDFLELILTVDGGGALTGGVLRLYGDVATTGAGAQFNKVRSMLLYTNSGRATQASHNVNTGGAVPGRSYSSATTDTVCNGSIGVSTPDGVTDITFTGGGGTPSSMADIKRALVQRTGILQGEHWGELAICTTNGNDTHYFSHTKLVPGITRLNSITAYASGTLSYCGGGSQAVGASDFEAKWQNQCAGDFDSHWLQGVWYDWHQTSNTIDFSTVAIPDNASCWVPGLDFGTRLHGNDILAAAADALMYQAFEGASPGWPAPGWHWVGTPAVPASGWEDME